MRGSDGLRTSKTVNGVKHNYYYVDGQLRYERNGDSYEIYYTYDADGRPVLATKRDLVAKKNYQYYLITNTRGDVIETRNGDGNVNARFVYDAWGKLISVTNASGTPLASDSFAYQISLKYRGYVYDNETGLYYLQSRYYDPETGRFINADDVNYIGYSGEQLSYNIFAYCENNAVNNSDPRGYVGVPVVDNYIYKQLLEYLLALLAGAAGGIQFVAIAIIIALIIDAIVSSTTISLPISNTKVLSDTAPKLGERDYIYRFAYVDRSTNKIIIFGKYMALDEVLVALGFIGAIYSLDTIYTTKPQKPIEVKGKGRIWGVHAFQQVDAKNLAVVLGSVDPPEIHEDGYLGHYHDMNHKMHIWFGNNI